MAGIKDKEEKNFKKFEEMLKAGKLRKYDKKTWEAKPEATFYKTENRENREKK